MGGRGAKRKVGDGDEPDENTGQTSESGSEESSGAFSSSDDEQSDAEADAEDVDVVDVDFEFFDPSEIDFHGLKSLLRTYLNGEEFSCSELVDAIIQQVILLTMLFGDVFNLDSTNQGEPERTEVPSVSRKQWAPP